MKGGRNSGWGERRFPFRRVQDVQITRTSIRVFRPDKGLQIILNQYPEKRGSTSQTSYAVYLDVDDDASPILLFCVFFFFLRSTRMNRKIRSTPAGYLTGCDFCDTIMGMLSHLVCEAKAVFTFELLRSSDTRISN